jgi:hypothetical protein
MPGMMVKTKHDVIFTVERFCGDHIRDNVFNKKIMLKDVKLHAPCSEHYPNKAPDCHQCGLFDIGKGEGWLSK